MSSFTPVWISASAEVNPASCGEFSTADSNDDGEFAPESLIFCSTDDTSAAKSITALIGLLMNGMFVCKIG